jgi:tetratricopeptide (TPR) repeat protein
MIRDKKSTNILFAVLVLALAGVALASMYLNKDRPVIQEAAAPDTAGMKLPENHPPLDVANRLNELERMSANEPQNAEYKTQIGDIYYDLGQYQKAIGAYEASLKLKPQDPGVETDLATCYHYLGQEDKALDQLNKTLEYRPDFSQALFNKGIVLVDGKHDTKGGIAVWEYLLKSNPGFPQRAQLEQKIRELRSSGK